MAIAAAKSWRPLVALMVAAVLACLAARAAAAEMAPSPASGGAGGQLDDEETNLCRRLLELKESDLELTGSEMVELQKYMDRVVVKVLVGGADFIRFQVSVGELTPRELGFKQGVVFAQAASPCITLLTRVSPQIPAFVGEKLHLKPSTSGIGAVHLP